MKALLIIDIQKGLTNRNLYKKELFLETVNKAIVIYRQNNDLIIFVQHENKQLVKGTNDWQLDDNIGARDFDKYFAKIKGDAFTNYELVEELNNNGVTDILVCGLVSHGCVAYTAKGGVSLGYKISLLKSGHTSWRKDTKEKIITTEKILSELGVVLKEYK